MTFTFWCSVMGLELILICKKLQFCYTYFQHQNGSPVSQLGKLKQVVLEGVQRYTGKAIPNCCIILLFSQENMFMQVSGMDS